MVSTCCTDERLLEGSASACDVSDAGKDSRWYALQTRSHCEAKVASHLGAFGIEVFFPDYASKRQWHDRVKVLRSPLFPGYLFARFQQRVPIAVLGAPGLARVVGFADGPAPIPDQEIESVRRLVDSGLNVWGCPISKVGNRVRLRSGPLKGLEGYLEKVKSQFQLVVSVELLGRSVAALIDADAIEVLH